MGVTWGTHSSCPTWEDPELPDQAGPQMPCWTLGRDRGTTRCGVGTGRGSGCEQSRPWGPEWVDQVDWIAVPRLPPSSTPSLSESPRFPSKHQLACLLAFFKTLAFLRGEQMSSASQVLLRGVPLSALVGPAPLPPNHRIQCALIELE